MTKEFISALTTVHDSVVRWSEDGGHYTLRFRGTKTGDPIISSVTLKTGAVFNIRAAGVQEVDGTEIGVMITDIGPDKQIAAEAIKALRNEGVVVEETEEGF